MQLNDVWDNVIAELELQLENFEADIEATSNFREKFMKYIVITNLHDLPSETM